MHDLLMESGVVPISLGVLHHIPEERSVLSGRVR